MKKESDIKIILKQILKECPGKLNDNTSACLEVWKRVLDNRLGVMPKIVEDVIREFKPETIVRDRRNIKRPTIWQKREELRKRAEYRQEKQEREQSKLII